MARVILLLAVFLSLAGCASPAVSPPATGEPSTRENAPVESGYSIAPLYAAARAAAPGMLLEAVDNDWGAPQSPSEVAKFARTTDKSLPKLDGHAAAWRFRFAAPEISRSMTVIVDESARVVSAKEGGPMYIVAPGALRTEEPPREIFAMGRVLAALRADETFAPSFGEELHRVSYEITFGPGRNWHVFAASAGLAYESFVNTTTWKAGTSYAAPHESPLRLASATPVANGDGYDAVDYVLALKPGEKAYRVAGLMIFSDVPGFAGLGLASKTPRPGEFSVSWTAGEASDGLLDEGDEILVHYLLVEGVVQPGRVVPIHFGADTVLDATVTMPLRE